MRRLEWFRVTLLQELDREERIQAEQDLQDQLDAANPHLQRRLAADERSQRFDSLDADLSGGGGGNFDGAGTGGQD